MSEKAGLGKEMGLRWGGVCGVDGTFRNRMVSIGEQMPGVWSVALR